MRLLHLLGILLAGLLPLRANESSPAPATAKPLPAALEEAGCGIMAKVIETAGLREKLEKAGPFTCFAPTDEAFKALPAEELKKYLDPARRDELARWAGYLIVESDMTEQDLLRSRRLPTLSGDFLTVWVSKGTIKLDRSATLVRKELPAANGLIHTLDRVIQPPLKED
ncbi:fasciclin domain-containing protein [Luteolibacter arcticus]|uniref:Fasciclin domain-containing protein n=1 Tax=Luteolibacter arcticus TaxID=1581411 RepID=A0ABT3GQW0_9BACT|nr:fasciclin domain-containing protein [Luteolibacter arcticus]MCW1925892.1 fasciclin domain-containing protein [Luteolibacter arcticus]